MDCYCGSVQDKSIVNPFDDECPPHPLKSLSLLEEGSSSLKDQSPYLILKRSLIVNPEWWPSSGDEIYEGLLFMDMLLMPFMCLVSGKYVYSVLNQIGFSPWNSCENDSSQKNGMF